jgi:outer membrane protease
MRSQSANRFLIAGFLLFAALPVNAINALSDHSIHPDSTNPFIASISLEMGIVNGNTREYVYDYDYQLSRLDWDLKPVYYGGVKVGVISDYGYINYDGVLTHYYRHACLLQKADLLDFNLGYSYSISDNLSLSALLGYHYMGLKVAAESGYYEYPPGSEQLPFYGVGISNEQMYNIPYIGLGTTCQVLCFRLTTC